MAHPIIDEILSETLPKELLLHKHTAFLHACEKEYDCTLDYLKLSGIFWSLTALDLLDGLGPIDKESVTELVVSCQQADGGLSPAPSHDSHLLSTLSGIQVLALFNAIERLNVDGICDYISSLQQPDGSFCGDQWGEIDTRFSFCAIASLSLLGKLHQTKSKIIDLDKAAEFLARCQNLDGGFGTRPGSESHAGQAYCVVGALSLLHQLHRLDLNRAAWWLAERQLPSGGLNGRPEKKPDVCYSWWTLATLAILGRLTWIKDLDLTRFILASQDLQTGGISDRPGNCPDPFHTLFGLAGLSLMAHLVHPDWSAIKAQTNPTHASDPRDESGPNQHEPFLAALAQAKVQLKPINPVFCMPQHVINRMQIKPQILT